MNDFGKRLKALRAELNMTQEQLAEHLGMARGYVNSVENGKSPATQHFVKQVCYVLGLPNNYFDGPEAVGISFNANADMPRFPEKTIKPCPDCARLEAENALLRDIVAASSRYLIMKTVKP